MFLNDESLNISASLAGGKKVGCPQEQAQDELWETVARPALLLRQKHHPQDGRQTLCLPLRVRSQQPPGPESWRAVQGLRRQAAEG